MQDFLITLRSGCVYIIADSLREARSIANSLYGKGMVISIEAK